MPYLFSREKSGPSPLLLGDDEDVVEEEEVAEAAGATAEDAGLLGEQQLPSLQQPPGRRDQRERLQQHQEKAQLLPSSPAAGTVKVRSEPEVALGSAGMDTPHGFKCPLKGIFQGAGGRWNSCASTSSTPRHAALGPQHWVTLSWLYTLQKLPASNSPVQASQKDSQHRSDLPQQAPEDFPPPLPQDLTFFFPNSSCFCKVYICSVLSIARAPSLQLLTSWEEKNIPREVEKGQ